MYYSPDHYFENLDLLPDGFFVSRGIKGVVCDIDNTLIRYTEHSPSDYSLRFLDRMKALGVKVMLISNNRGKERIKIFSFRGEVDIIGRAGKPAFSKKKILSALESNSLSPDDVIFIGDQIFTDVAAARKCGIKTLLVDPLGPSHLPGFAIKRALEIPIKRSYIKKHGKNS